LKLKDPEIRFRKNGTPAWRQKWINPDTGKELSTTFDDVDVCDKFRAELVLHGRPTETFSNNQAAITLDEYAPIVIAASKGSPKYKKDNLRDYRAHVSPHLGKMRVADIGWGAISDWQNKLIANGLSYKSIDTYRQSILSPVFMRAQRRGPNNEEPIRKDGSPLRDAPLPTNPNPYRADIVTTEEASLFFQAAHSVSESVTYMLLFMFSTGFRWGEVTALRVGAINFINGTVTMLRVSALDENNQRYEKTRGKSKESTDRIVPLPEFAVEVLRAVCEGRGYNDYVFVNAAGRPWPRSSFANIWTRILVAAHAAGFPPKENLTPHGMRHSYMTHLGQNQIGDRSMMKVAGWVTPNMAKRYTEHLDVTATGHVRAAANSLVNELANVIPIRKSA
jgi:integrase